MAALATDPKIKARFTADKARKDTKKVVFLSEANRYRMQSRQLGQASDAKLRPHERLALALNALQIAIGLAAITVLTKRRWLL